MRIFTLTRFLRANLLLVLDDSEGGKYTSTLWQPVSMEGVTRLTKVGWCGGGIIVLAVP